jgi:Bacteriophage Mu Gam like protein
MPDIKLIESDDFSIVAHRLELFATSRAALDHLEASQQQAYLALIDAVKTEFLKLQRKVAWAEESIVAIADAHPEWFSDGKTLTTPFGAVHSQKTTKHEVPDEARSIALIKSAAWDSSDPAERARWSALIRTEESINLEAVANLSQRELSRFRIVRIKGESITIKPAKVGVGNAVRKQAAKSKKEASKLAKAA